MVHQAALLVVGDLYSISGSEDRLAWPWCPEMVHSHHRMWSCLPPYIVCHAGNRRIIERKTKAVIDFYCVTAMSVFSEYRQSKRTGEPYFYPAYTVHQ